MEGCRIRRGEGMHAIYNIEARIKSRVVARVSKRALFKRHRKRECRGHVEG